jgi:tetratricopeptide (TPR) repeat protein
MLLHPPLAFSQQSPSLSPTHQVQQELDRYQAGDYLAAVSLWQSGLEQYRQVGNRNNQAIVLENLARAYQQLGQTEAEMIQWQKLLPLYRQQKDLASISCILAEQAQAYSRNGQPRKAIALLCNPDAKNTCAQDSALHLARASQSREVETAVQVSLGNAYRLLGDFQSAIAALTSSLELAQKLNHPTY